MTRRDALKGFAAVGGLMTFGSASAWSQTQTQPPAQPGEFALPPLGYEPDALEPFIDAETMRIHHGRHHQTYVNNLNAAIKKEPSLSGKSIEELLRGIDSIPESVRKDIRNQGGGHHNHSVFWKTLKKGTSMPADLQKALEDSFGSVDAFKTQFTEAATKVFGSGWAWLVARDNKLVIESTPNQDSPLMTGGFPLLGIDVWEHAYYLKYQNKRADYIKAFFEVVNWPYIAERLKSGA
jgi:Fe-Mn family superoxide dismutase